eukprot:TRINITY_DN8607_c1_g1_i1.p1 TRINITY_DN8607_c1_g1~~TRINITY_DN8607_c1_g1_i1.p1  ORF type:complete len:569 (+),score=76.11 TRINITY_DN8607_c1_g1_i1:123-1829(+)
MQTTTGATDVLKSPQASPKMQPGAKARQSKGAVAFPATTPNAASEAQLSHLREDMREHLSDVMKQLGENLREDLREAIHQIYADAEHPHYNARPWFRKRTASAAQITALLGGTEQASSSSPRNQNGLVAVDEDGETAAPYQKDDPAISAPLVPEFPTHYPMDTHRVSRESSDDEERALVSHREPTITRLFALSTFCAYLVGTKAMQSMVASAVLLNAMAMGYQTEWQSHHVGESKPLHFFYIDCGFAVAFTCELLLRLVAFGPGLLCCVPDWPWNVFDFLVVVSSVADLLPATSNDSQQAGVLRMLRVLRVVRAARVVRVLRFIEELRTIVVCIVGSLRSLGWTLLLLFILIYVASLCVTQVVVEHRESSDQTLDDEDMRQLIYWYGSLARTCLSLYQAITSGSNWDDAMMALEKVNPGFTIFWIAYIAFTVFAMLNVVTGVFVERAMESAMSDKEDYMMSTICDIFRRSHLGAAGEITWEEFEASLCTDEMQAYFKAIDVGISEARSLFNLLDAEKSGSVNVVEFVSGCIRLTGHAKALDLALVLNETRGMWSWAAAELKAIQKKLE